MSAALRAGVVGVGHLGRHHARLYATLPGSRLVGVVDADPERAAAIAGQFGARVFPDVPALAAEIDLASVATPTVAHEQPARELMEAGVPVLIEKPIAPDAAAGRRLVDAAARRGLPLMIGHSERFHPAVVALAGRLDGPKFLEIHRLAPFVPRSLDVDVVLDLMIHDLDLCRLVFGPRRAELIEASGAAAATPSLDIASARLRFEGGAAANLTSSRVSARRVRRIRVFQAGECWVCDTGNSTLQRVALRSAAGGVPEVVEETVEVAPGEPLGNELSVFLRLVRGEKVAVCTGEDGLAALELALGVRRSIEEH